MGGGDITNIINALEDNMTNENEGTLSVWFQVIIVVFILFALYMFMFLGPANMRLHDDRADSFCSASLEGWAHAEYYEGCLKCSLQVDDNKWLSEKNVECKMKYHGMGFLPQDYDYECYWVEVV